jgi:hypothetical protein
MIFFVVAFRAYSRFIYQMGIYAFLGVAQAIAFFAMGSMFALLTFFASQQLHKVNSLTWV